MNDHAAPVPRVRLPPHVPRLLEAVHEGVVLARTLPVHEVPEPRSKVSFELHPGVKLRMLDRSGDFVRVRLPNGLEGWTDPAGVSPLR